MAVSFRIAEEVAKQKFCKFANLLEAIDAGIRIGFSYTTLGVVSSPIEGYTGIKLRKDKRQQRIFYCLFFRTNKKCRNNCKLCCFNAN